MLRVLCIIDSLGSGGAQRQMASLACGLTARGHEVELLLYHPHAQFYREQVNSAGVRVHEVVKPRGFSLAVPLSIARVLRSSRFDAVVSFLGPVNVYSALGRLLSLSPARHLVSERVSQAGDRCRLQALAIRLSYIVADKVVSNSRSHSEYLRQHRWLRDKVCTIYNGYEFSAFRPVEPAPDRQCISCLVVGRIHEQKNALRLADALIRFYHRNGFVPKLRWVGRQEADCVSLQLRDAVDRRLRSHPHVGMHWEWLGERHDVPQLLADCDVLVHPSLYEGLPNVICEAFIAGRPVIASAVCDHPLLVEEGVRGLLCDPLSPASICDALERFVALTHDRRVAMGRAARAFAEDRLSLERMVSDYERLLRGSRS